MAVGERQDIAVAARAQATCSHLYEFGLREMVGVEHLIQSGLLFVRYARHKGSLDTCECLCNSLIDTAIISAFILNVAFAEIHDVDGRS